MKEYLNYMNEDILRTETEFCTVRDELIKLLEGIRPGNYGLHDYPEKINLKVSEMQKLYTRASTLREYYLIMEHHINKKN